ncbi:MAG TPA: hypothetical protein VIN07_00170, partial [Flavipsychrobacter sp.]
MATMEIFVWIWFSCLIVSAFICYIKYKEFVHFIELEDLKNNNSFDYHNLPDDDKKFPIISLYRIVIFGHTFYYRPPLSI